MTHQVYKQKEQPKKEVYEPPYVKEGSNRKERRMQDSIMRRSTKGPRSGK
jgi:hypothetical protein